MTKKDIIEVKTDRSDGKEDIMNNISAYSVKKPITVLMGMLIVITLGIFSLTRLPVSLFPDVELPYAVVVTTYQGANPYEVEAEVTNRIEATASQVSNFSSVSSTSSEHFSLVMITFADETNMDYAFLELRENLDNISFKEGVAKPRIIRFSPDMLPVLTVTIYRDFGLNDDTQNLIETTKWLENDIMTRLQSIAGVADVSLSGAASTEIEVVLNANTLASYGLTESYVLEMIKDQNIEGLAGITPDGSDIRMLYIGNKIEGINQLKSTQIYYDSGSDAIITLDDLSESITFVNTATSQYAKINGEQGISIAFRKQSDVGITEVTSNIHKLLKDITSSSEYDASYTTIVDQGDYINLSINSILNNLIIGGTLAVIILFLFLKDIKPTLIVGIAIPVSVVASFALMYLFNVSLNIISMGGLALGIGMLVDNSIVVIENIYRLLGEGKSKQEAAITGAKQVMGAITASTLTTVAVFLPVAIIGGLISDVFMAMALTIAFSLGASLVIALSLVPSMSSRFLNDQKFSKESKSLIATKKAYETSIRFVLKNKVTKSLTIVIVLALLGLTTYLSINKGFELMPQSDEGSIQASITFSKDIEFTKVASLLDGLSAELLEHPDIETVSMQYGGSRGFMGMMMGSNQNSANISIVLVKGHKMTTAEVSIYVEELLLTYSYEDYNINEDQVLESSVNASNNTRFMFGGSGINIVVKGQNLYTMELVANRIASIVDSVEGTKKVDPGISRGEDVIKLTVNKDEAIKANIAVNDVSRNITVFYNALGFDITSFGTGSMLKVVDNGVEYNVFVPQDPFNVTISAEAFLSMVQLFDRTMLPIIEQKLAENDETFRLYMPNIELVEGMGLLDPSKPAGAIIINPMIRFDEATNSLVTSMNPLDPRPSLSSLSQGSVYSGNLPTSIVRVTKETGFSSIYTDGKYRTLSVSASLETGYNITKVSEEVNRLVRDYLNSSEFTALSSGIVVEFSGENEAINDALGDLLIAGLVAILLVYMIMAIQFQSLIYPFIVMGTIPLAFTGGFLALLITGGSLNIVSVMGLVILVGVVVNNGIVLIDYINQLRDQGKTIKQAIIEAGKTRLRPIFMTALTTILALLGMAIGFGDGAELLQPLAITAIGGLIYSTILTLIVIPLIYCLVNARKVRKEDELDECRD